MILEDPEFGEIVVRKNAWVRGVKFTVGTSGRLQMTVPTYAKPFLIKRFLNVSRDDIRAKLPVKDPKTQRARDAKKRILTHQAKDYLPPRLDFYAKKFGYAYDHLKFSHANTRWGSCTHHKKLGSKDEITISLNIGLMNVPEPLRDYVILHELAHINHPDHSTAFWAEVASHDPRYKAHRAKLKQFNPGV